MIRPMKILEEEYIQAIKEWDMDVMELCVELGVSKNYKRDDILHWFSISLDMFDRIIDYYGIEHWLKYAKSKSFEHIFPQYQKPKDNWWRILNYYISKGIAISESFVYLRCHSTTIKYEENYANQTIVRFYKENK